MATITEAGATNGLILYSGAYDMYIAKSIMTHFRKANTTRICIGCGAYHTELEFDDETQRDAAITTLLSYY